MDHLPEIGSQDRHKLYHVILINKFLWNIAPHILFLIIEQVLELDDTSVDDEKKELVIKLLDMLFTSSEVSELMTLMDEGFTSSQIIESLKFYDLTEHHDQIHAAKDIRSPSKMKDILKRIEKGIIYH